MKKIVAIGLGVTLILIIGGAVYATGVFKKEAVETPIEAMVEATTTPEIVEQVVTITPEADTTSKDSAPAFVCDKGVPDPNPNVDSPLTRGLVIQALNRQNDIINNAPVSCVRTYFLLGMTDGDPKGIRFIESLTDQEFMFQVKLMRAIMDDPDPTRMLHPDTTWDLRDNGSLVITEIVNGSSKGHWNPHYANGMWW